MYSCCIKRCLDVLFSLIMLVILSPIFLIVWILLLLSFKGGDAFFIQPRPGKDLRIFSVIKFKTMNDKKDELGNLLPDYMRITKLGRVIRKTSIDELPQLINVIKGDMSLVGPRPLLVRYLPFYTKSEKVRHTVRPGITGLAQINGRNNLKWDDRLSLDIEYVQKMSFWLDFLIMYKTVLKVLTKESVVIDPLSIMKNLDDERSSFEDIK